MKKFILFSIVSLISVASYCLSEVKSEMFARRAFNLLQANAGHLTLKGDVNSTEKLTEILDTVKTSSSHSVSCAENSVEVSTCTLFIEHKPVGETAVTFEVRLDENSMPKRIMGDVEISRGD